MKYMVKKVLLNIFQRQHYYERVQHTRVEQNIAFWLLYGFNNALQQQTRLYFIMKWHQKGKGEARPMPYVMMPFIQSYFHPFISSL